MRLDAYDVVMRLRRVISELRGAPFCEVKVRLLRHAGREARVEGEYALRSLFSSVEEGEFEAVLDEELNPISVSIRPRAKPSVRAWVAR
ncbi:MAG: hypothetical protein DRN99_06970 [Thermoproteota archaeon]|nr:MAG: hypothetical protein DRN99_06970 [Candidatus Korarchaeota archaeon]